MTASAELQRATSSLELYLDLNSHVDGLTGYEDTIRRDIDSLRNSGTEGHQALHDFATRFGDKFGIGMARTLFREVDEIAAETLAQFAESGNAVPTPPSGRLKNPLEANFGSLKIVDGFPRGFAESTMRESLDVLGGPTAIVLNHGKPTTRVFSVLMHASEPSGLAAALAYARTPESDPQANIVFIVHNVRAAVLGNFAERFLPADQVDLNRQWANVATNPEASHPYTLEVFTFLQSLGKIDFVHDFHNNSGDNPLYSVFSKNPGNPLFPSAPTQNDFLSENLAMLLTDRYMGVPLAGGFDDGMRSLAPSITIECGKRMTGRADMAAEAIMRRLVTAPPNFASQQATTKPRYEMTAVLGLDTPERPLGFMGMTAAEQALAAGAFLLRPDMERLNFRDYRSGTVLGQYRGEGLPVQAVTYGPDERVITDEWFHRDGDLIRLRQGACFAMGSTHKPTINKFGGWFTQTARVAAGKFFR